MASGGGVNRWNKEDFWSGENNPRDTITMDMCHYTFVQTQRTRNTKGET